MKDLGKLIKEARMNKGLTQLDVSKHLGFKMPQFVSLMENGHSVIPLNVLKKLIPYLGLNKRIVVQTLVNSYTDSITKEL